MNEQLRLLIDLQKVDSIILSTRLRIDEIPSKISAQEIPFKNSEDAYEKARQNHALLEKKKKEKENAINDLSEKINKLKQRSSEIKTNKEYQAHLKEIEKAEKEVRSSEDDLLSIMSSLEDSLKVLESEKTALAKDKEKIEESKKSLESEASIYKEEIRKHKEERNKLTDKIEDDIYNMYMNLMKSCRGLAVVQTKDSVCHGCNLHIPPQLYVEIKNTDEIIQCPQCRRILYYLKEEKDK